MRKLFLMVLFVAPLANATVYYVNKDNACPGAGTSTAPYCSIQNAFNVAVAGDDIRIRHSTMPYDEHVVAQSSGTSGNPIVVESDDPSNQAVVRYTGNGAVAGAIQVLDKSYWTIQNLTFDGTGVFTSTMAVWVGLSNTARWTTGPDLTGIKILNNTFKNWGGTEAQESSLSASTQSAVGALFISGGYGPPIGAYTISGTLVQGNLFDTNRMLNLAMTSTKNSLVQNNEFKNTTCGQGGSGSSGVSVTADGIHIITGTVGWATTDTYKNNVIHDFQSPSSCGLTISGDGYWEWDGLHTDVYPINGTVDGNTFYNIDPTNIHPGASNGVHIEAGSFGWTVKNNVIYNTGRGILTNQQTGSGTPILVTNNTIYNTAETGIEARWGYVTIENNIIDNSGSVQIYVRSQAVSAGNITIDYNDYWDLSGGNKVGSWNEGPVQNFSNWKAQCGCDVHSLNANPLFVSPPSNFSLQPSSPAIGAGLGGVNMGASIGGATAAPAAPTGLTAIVH
jgi:hypothetical protein